MKKIGILLLTCIVLLSFFIAKKIAADSQTVNINATVVSLCGNGVVSAGEQCDGASLNGQTCLTRGFSGGFLNCNNDCTFDTTFCTASAGSVRGGSNASAVAAQAASRAQNQVSEAAKADTALNTIIYQKILEIYQEIVKLVAAKNNQPASLAKPSKAATSASAPTPQALLENGPGSYLAALLPPQIIDYSPKLKVGDDLVIRGHTNYPNGKVQVFISQENSDKLVISDAKSDARGDFVFTYKLPPALGSSGTAAIFDIFKRAYVMNVWTVTLDEHGSHGDIGKKLSIAVDQPFASFSLDPQLLFTVACGLLLLLLLLYIISRRFRASRAPK